MHRWPIWPLILALPSLVAAATTLDRAEETQRASGLGSVSCELEAREGIPGWFRYRPGSLYLAETAIVLPVAYEEVSRRVMDLGGYPEWLLLDRGGRPTLGALTVGDDGRSARLLLRPEGEEFLEGSVETFRSQKATGLRLHARLDGAIKEAVLEATALRMEGCDARTLVVMRAEWKLGFLARAFGGQQKGLPALLLLGVRADLVSATVHDPELLLGSGGDAMGPVARVLPVRIQVNQDRFGPIDRVIRRWSERSGRVDPDDVFAALLDALEGRHDLVGYWVWFKVDEQARFLVTGNEKERSFVFVVTNGPDGLSLSVVP